MIAYCFLCQTAYKVAGEPEEIERLLDMPEWRESLPCATSRCLGRAARVPMSWVVANKDKVRKVEEIPLQTYYRVINGFGRPDTSPAGLPAVKSELVTKRVASVDGYSVGDPERTIVKSIMMEDGTRLHFASSTHGACIYAIDEPGPTCVEVFDDQLEAANSHPGVLESGGQGAQAGGVGQDGDNQIPGEGGEEAGRGDEDDEGSGSPGPSSAAEPHGPGVSALPERSPLPPVAKQRG